MIHFITSSGMRLFLDLLKVAKSKGSNVTIIGLNNDIRNVFDEVGFTSIFNIH